MKILHLVSGGIDGGAARGAYWLHQAQREIGLDSILLTNGADDLDDPSVVALGSSRIQRLGFALRSRASQAMALVYRNRRPWIFSTGFDGVDITKYQLYQEADVIHLHWINGLVRIRPLRKVDKPMVWTLRDMWPMTGGCHYAMECERYTTGCGRCPQLGSNSEWDLTKIVFGNKQKSLPRKVRLVGISRWLSECAARSRVFDGCSVQTISNNVDTATFSPMDQSIAREVLGLPMSARIILVGAQSVSDFYKGFDLLRDSLKSDPLQDAHLVLFGREGRRCLDELGVEGTALGFVSDSLVLRLAYSAADVFVAPSRMDAFGKTIAEAMACGTPVVCFDATGPRDIVEHKVTGYRAMPWSPEDLAAGIEWILARSSEECSNLRRQSRERVVRLFDSKVIARQYKALYQEMLA